MNILNAFFCYPNFCLLYQNNQFENKSQLNIPLFIQTDCKTSKEKSKKFKIILILLALIIIVYYHFERLSYKPIRLKNK